MKTLNFQNLADYTTLNISSEYAVNSLLQSISRSFEDSEPSGAFITALDTTGLIVESAEVSQTAYFNFNAYTAWVETNASVNQQFLQLVSDAVVMFNSSRVNSTTFLRQFLANAGFLNFV